MSERTIPAKVVVGMGLEPQDGLPRVVVKGCGEFADRILRERDWLHGAPVVSDPQLAEQLYRLPLDGQIGPELFELVAILLTHVFSLDEKLRRTHE